MVLRSDDLSEDRAPQSGSREARPTRRKTNHAALNCRLFPAWVEVFRTVYSVRLSLQPIRFHGLCNPATD
jgi:hypothetical protein